MATTGREAWETLTEHERELACDSAYDAFLLGFSGGWQAQENRPFHCAYCGYECKGDTDAATIELAREHAGACEDHPLAAEIRRLRIALAGIAEGCGHTRCHAYPWIRAARRVLGVSPT
jgi:hypothetical protein